MTSRARALEVGDVGIGSAFAPPWPARRRMSERSGNDLPSVTTAPAPTQAARADDRAVHHHRLDADQGAVEPIVQPCSQSTWRSTSVAAGGRACRCRERVKRPDRAAAPCVIAGRGPRSDQRARRARRGDGRSTCTAPSWTLLSVPMTMGSLSARATAPARMVARSPTLTAPMRRRFCGDVGRERRPAAPCRRCGKGPWLLSLSACRAGWGGRRGSRRYVRRSAAAAGARRGGGRRA